ncbi:MAG: hypothetical protein JOZ69_18540 [Myxococcales bacterium]|nr:hypothetical protein [Myxococcales bacterium]
MRSRRRAPIVVLAGAACCALAWACTGESSPPLGSGDNVKMDIDASVMPVQDADPGPDSPFAPLDGPYGSLGDAYGLAVCAGCACEAGTFCYGGSPGSPLSSCDQTAAAAGAPLALGCHPIPSACATATEECVCLLQSLPRDTSCYPVCTAPASGGFVVYCPQ